MGCPFAVVRRGRSRLLVRWAGAALCIAVVAAGARSPVVARPRGVVIRVVDGASGAGIDAAEVTAVGTGDVARTTPDGLVTLPNRDRLGGMEVRVRKLGVTVLDTLLQLREGETVPIALRLAPPG